MNRNSITTGPQSARSKGTPNNRDGQIKEEDNMTDDQYDKIDIEETVR